MLKFIHSNQIHTDNELEIAFDEEGANLLIATIQKVLQSRDHEHLLDNPLGRNSLTVERGTDCPIKLVTVRYERDA